MRIMAHRLHHPFLIGRIANILLVKIRILLAPVKKTAAELSSLTGTVISVILPVP